MGGIVTDFANATTLLVRVQLYHDALMGHLQQFGGWMRIMMPNLPPETPAAAAAAAAAEGDEQVGCC